VAPPLLGQSPGPCLVSEPAAPKRQRDRTTTGPAIYDAIQVESLFQALAKFLVRTPARNGRVLGDLVRVEQLERIRLFLVGDPLSVVLSRRFGRQLRRIKDVQGRLAWDWLVRFARRDTWFQIQTL